MKILLTSDWPVSAINGVAVSTLNLYKSLKDLGHDVKVLTLSDTNKYYKDGDFYYIKSFDLHFYPQLKATTKFRNKYVKEIIWWKPDVVHSQCEFFTFSIANIIAHKCQTPIVHTFHTLYDHYTSYISKNDRLMKHILTMVMKIRLEDADVVISPTLKVAQTLKPIVKSKLVIMPSGIDLSKYHKPANLKKIKDLRESYGIGPDKKILLSLGRVSKEKNHQESMENFARLCQDRDDLVFMIVGQGPYLDNLKSLAQDLAIGDRVIFTGMADPQDTPNYYKLADLFICASVSETQGLTYIEAMANGLAQVCRKDPALIGVIKEGYNGYTYQTQEEFLTYVNKILDNDNLRQTMSQNAVKNSKKFSIEDFGKNALAIYKMALRDYRPKNRILPRHLEKLIANSRYLLPRPRH